MKHCIFFACNLIFLTAIGQQLPNLSLYREYQSYLNPAALTYDYFRFDRNVQFGISHRSQWINFDQGSPSTSFIHGTYIGDQLNTKLILGGNLLSDKAGPIHHYGLNGKVGVMFSDDPLYGGISAALTLGYKITKLDQGKLRTSDGINASQFIGENNVNGTPDIGIGVYFHKRLYNEDNFYSGLSMAQLLSINSINKEDNYSIRYIPHFYFVAGYIKYLNDDAFLETTSWVKYVQGSSLGVDLNIKYQMDQSFWIGAGASKSKSIRFEIGLVLGENIGFDNQMRIGYSYEDGFNQFANIFGKTHEINISYAFDSRK